MATARASNALTTLINERESKEISRLSMIVIGRLLSCHEAEDRGPLPLWKLRRFRLGVKQAGLAELSFHHSHQFKHGTRVPIPPVISAAPEQVSTASTIFRLIASPRLVLLAWCATHGADRGFAQRAARRMCSGVCGDPCDPRHPDGPVQQEEPRAWEPGYWPAYFLDGELLIGTCQSGPLELGAPAEARR
jgi:hypothetical protein